MVIVTDSSGPLVVVTGSTGLQGGSVVNALDKSLHPYRIRGITRDATKPKATSLSKRGVEITTCNLSADNGPEIEKAFAGADYVFITTNYWEHLDGNREKAEGIAMVDAARNANVKMLIISSLVNVTEASNGELTHVSHFDSKAAVARYAREVKIPYVEVQASSYMNNLITNSRPRPVGDAYVIQGMWSPELKFPLIDTYHDYGLFVQLALESEDYNNGDGKVISAYSEWASMEEMARTLSEITGKTVKYEKISEEQCRMGLGYAGMPAHSIEDMIDMFKFHELVWPKVFVTMDLSKLSRKPRTFKEYAAQEDWTHVLV